MKWSLDELASNDVLKTTNAFLQGEMSVKRCKPALVKSPFPSLYVDTELSPHPLASEP